MEEDPIPPTHGHMDSDPSKSSSPYDEGWLQMDDEFTYGYEEYFNPYAEINMKMEERFRQLDLEAQWDMPSFVLSGFDSEEPWSRITLQPHLFPRRIIADYLLEIDMELATQIMCMYELVKKEVPPSTVNLRNDQIKYGATGDPVYDFVLRKKIDNEEKYNLLSPQVISNFLHEYCFEVEEEPRLLDNAKMASYLVEGTYQDDYEDSDREMEKFLEKLEKLFPFLMMTTFGPIGKMLFMDEMEKLITNPTTLNEESAKEWIAMRDRSGLAYKQPFVSQFEYLKEKFKAALEVGLIDHLPWNSL